MARQMSFLFCVALCVAMLHPAHGESTWDYVQDGLVACWDGAENAGRLSHNPNATVWKDVVGGREFTLTGVTVEADRMVFAGSNKSYGTLSADDTAATFDTATGGTLEIVYAAPSTLSSTVNYVLLQSSTTSGIAFGINKGPKILAGNKSAKPFSFDSGTTTNFVAVRYSSATPQSLIANGTARGTTSSATNWSSSDTTTIIGNRTSKANGFPGAIYCVRLYNRQLTSEEIAVNQAVDASRFREGTYYGEHDLLITASPLPIGTPTPAYGVVRNLAAEATRLVSCPAVWTNEAQTAIVSCHGWIIYDGNCDLVASGPETSFTYTHPDPAAYRCLKWQLAVEYKISATAGMGGSVSPTEQWVALNETATVTATSDTGKFFHKWTNDVPASVTATSATISFPVSKPEMLFAVFGSTRYVENAATIQAMIDASSPGDIITLADNLYRPDYTIFLSNGVTLAGSSFTNCVIKPSGNRRVIEIIGEGSCLSNITITGGSVTPSANGERASGICLDGGIVSHCMVSNNVLNNGSMTHLGVGIYMLDGLIENSIITGNSLPHQWSYGAGIYMENGLVRNCTVSNNSHGGSNSFGGGIATLGGTISHCVIFGNAANYGGGICFAKYNAGLKADVLVDRCLIYGNTGRTSGGGVASYNGNKVNNVQHKWTMRHTTVAKNNCTRNAAVSPGGLFMRVSATVGSCESCIFADNSQTYNDESEVGRPNWCNDTTVTTATTNNLAKVFHNCLFGNGSFALGSDSISGNAAFESLANNDYHLTAASDAVDNGLVSDNVTDDLDGNAVTDGKPDIGCFEANFANDPFSCSITYSAASVFEGATVSLSAAPVNPPAGVTIRYVWTLTDGGDNTVQAQGLSATATLANVAVYSVTLRAYNNDTDELLTETTGESTIRIYPPVVYAYPGDDIADFAADLVDGQRLILAEGTYQTAKTVSVMANATVEGAGIDRTVIAFTSQDKSFRIRAMNAHVSGITVRGCRSSGSTDSVWVEHGTLADSRITQCIVENAQHGYTALQIDAGALVERCIIDHNTNSTSRGLNAWTYSRASAAVVVGTMRNCLIHHNYSAASEGTVSVKGVMENCTVVDNLNNGGTLEAVAMMLGNNATIRNTVAARNLSPNWTTNHVETSTLETPMQGSPPNWAADGKRVTAFMATSQNNCWGESPETYGTHCADGSGISFCNPENGDWRIRSNSSCRDAGVLNATWMTVDAIDLAGKPRVFHDAVDIGCYENQGSPSTVIMLR